jgi:LysM repeat protein
MMKQFSWIVLGIFYTNVLLAQTPSIHTIQKGETIGVVARKYNVTVKDILQINGLADNTILKIGQIVKLPRTATKNNKTVEPKTVAKPEPKAVKIPANASQYLVEKGDNLTKIAQKFEVTKQQLIEWNNLSNDNIKVGSYLIVSTKKEKPVKTVETKKIEITKKDNPIEEPKVTPKVEKPIEIKKPVETVPKPIEEPKKNTSVKDEPKTSTNVSNKGAFEDQYSNSNNSVEGLSGIFKTIAGWHDKKYYILLNNAQSGSVVKVIANNKFVYAKVLGPLPDLKDDKNLTMRLSNATAAALGIQENRFTTKVEF